MGSSNASANGLAVEGEPANSWMEANVRLDDPFVREEIEQWFSAAFDAGHAISDADLDRAERLWKARAKLAPSGASYVGNLLAAFASAPDHPVWRQVKLAFWMDWLADADQKWFKAEYEAGRLSRDVDVYSEWNESILPGDWVLDFNLAGDGPKYGIWRALPAQFGRPDLRFAREMKHLNFAAFGRLQITDNDFTSLGSIAAVGLQLRGDQERRNAVIDLPTAMELLASARAMPSEKAFLAAMERIYDEAAEIDYYPREFRRMLAEFGSVQTARQLVRGRATYGLGIAWCSSSAFRSRGQSTMSSRSREYSKNALPGWPRRSSRRERSPPRSQPTRRARTSTSPGRLKSTGGWQRRRLSLLGN